MLGFAGCSMMRATSAREDEAFLLCGLDEAGRGPLAGPVVASAVVLPDDFPSMILNDSKKLSAKRRELAEKIIKEKACWGIGIVSHRIIDEINILEASLLAMKKAYEALSVKFDAWVETEGVSAKTICAVADGTFCPDIGCECRSEVKADAKYAPVMAASILAKHVEMRWINDIPLTDMRVTKVIRLRSTGGFAVK